MTIWAYWGGSYTTSEGEEKRFTRGFLNCVIVEETEDFIKFTNDGGNNVYGMKKSSIISIE